MTLLSGDEAHELSRRRLADQRIRRLSRAAMAQQLHLARSRSHRIAVPPTSGA